MGEFDAASVSYERQPEEFRLDVKYSQKLQTVSAEDFSRSRKEERERSRPPGVPTLTFLGLAH